ncbi:glycoside hydrolase family 3 protein [Streptomyces microflavus]|uniref:glycoside hydrolase family 3 protein n=1 Tax=Streptomyces TaxID=1883 RepID=UPI000B9197FA|nr:MULTISPECIES: glycoside hydrolase family 3 C-terminal domain-containing protein [unclassified Streptomyces]MEE1730066.1 glycoside hydrolase family 3 C-terminal domain-containing protein [Streptomyces sp. BE282]OXY86361.1 glycosyl hydrolase [Streptomyces sp. 2R]WTF69077.1 glycoside hydrolase family 3 C-terminal domain-containing protein [Streptomyces microflavus]
MAAASSTSTPKALRREAVDTALAALGLDDKTRLLAGQDLWSLPALPAIGLRSLVMSDGPIGVRGVRWTAADPSVALPSPTALAATWDPELARRAGRLLAQEARRKGVHVLLAPTVNLHRTPLGGRHFEAYSEDPYLTGEIGTGYVRGVQDGGVATTVKHFVANDAETDRFTVNNTVAPRPLRELYLAPFERIVRNAHPWGIMAAYNQVNGSTMTEHRYLQNAVLRGEWGFDGFIVSDWLAARTTVGAITGGLDAAMPGPRTVYGEALADAVRAGEVDEKIVDLAVRNILLLAARTGALESAPPAVPAAALPATVDGDALAREIARRSFVLVRNEVRDGADALPLAPGTTVALSGALARDARVLGGGSALVFPDHVVSPLDGLTAALPEGALTYAVGADPSDELAIAEAGFDLTAVCRDVSGAVLATVPLPSGQIQWIGADLPDGVTHDTLDTVEITGTFTPRASGEHTFGTRGTGSFALTVDDRPLFDGTQDRAPGTDPLGAFFNEPVERGRLPLTEGAPVRVSLSHRPGPGTGHPLKGVAFSLVHLAPLRDPDELIAEAVEAARTADTAIVVVGTTERVESEGFDRTDLKLPGHQDALVHAVAAVNPRTVVVVNSGSPVELPWRNEVAAVLLSWFPGQEAGHALADVLRGQEEPGGRLPTTWPVALADVPVSVTTPTNGELPYTEGVFIGYRAWEKAGTTPAYAFGHGLGYTTWEYESVSATPDAVTVRVRNTGSRPGSDTVQIYLAPAPAPDAPERPARWLAGFARVTAAPGGSVEVTVPVETRAYQVWDEEAYGWKTVPGTYEVQAARSLADVRATTTVDITA